MASRVEQKEQAREQRLAAEAAAQRSDRRRAQLMRLGLVVGLAIVVVIAAVIVSGGSGKSSGASGGGSSKGGAATTLFKGIPQQGVTLGSPKAKATLIEFADLQCPYCGEYSNQGLATVIGKYVRTGRLRYQLHIRSFLGPDSVKAAGAAAAATQENRLYQFATTFYERQGEENTGYVTPSFIRGVASAAGVAPAKAAAAAANPNGQPLVAKAEKLASQYGSSSTPGFYLRLASGRLVPVQPSTLDGPGMTQAIDAALKQ